MARPSCPTSRSTGKSWSAETVAPSFHRGRRGAEGASRSRRCSTRRPADLENLQIPRLWSTTIDTIASHLQPKAGQFSVIVNVESSASHIYGTNYLAWCLGRYRYDDSH